MINFVCVYRTGKVYTPEYVLRLAQSIAENMCVEHTFTVLTDDPRAFSDWLRENRNPGQFKDVNALLHVWPGYWSKMELFRPDLFTLGSFVVYLDLDTIPRRHLGLFTSLRAGCTPLHFFMLTDWLEPAYFNSSVMAWNAGYFGHLYQEFASDPDGYMREYKRYPAKWGDQSFITDHLGFIPDSLQEEYPGRFVSYKASPMAQKKDASVVCFHGNPRPHVVNWDPLTPFPPE